MDAADLEKFLIALLGVQLVEALKVLINAVLEIIVDVKRRCRLLDVIEYLVLVVLPRLVDDPVPLVDLRQVSQDQRLTDHLGNQLQMRRLITINQRLQRRHTLILDL